MFSSKRLRAFVRRRWWGAIVAVAVLSLSAHTTFAVDDRGSAFFEASIRPVLVEHCYECHSAEAAKQDNLQAGLLLDTKQGMLTGGEAGPAILPGDPENSLLLLALRRDKDQMPPDQKLPDEVIDRFAKWIAMGAPDPRDGGAVAPTPRRTAFAITEADRNHWAFQPVRDVPPPAVNRSGWSRDALDRFVLAQLEAHDLQPNGEADRYALLRRTTYVLTGLPPTPAEITAFLADERPEAFESVVDHLLASPEFGAHWGRHWLDGVRYADSVDQTGAYRDWVIRALNSDLPYDEFIRLQIAGDLIPAGDTPPDRVHASGASLDGITATGMLALAVWEIVGRDLAVAEIVDSQIDVVGRQVMGLTLSCARCHDHKFDPVSIEDYYGLAGIFFSSHIATGKLVADGRLANELTQVPLLNLNEAEANRRIDERVAAWEQRIKTLEAEVPQAARLAAIKSELPELNKQIEQTTSAASKQSLVEQVEKLRAEQHDLEANQLDAGWDINPAELSEAATIRDQIAALQSEKRTAVGAVAILEGGVPGSNRAQIGDAPVYLRGEYQHPGPIVARRFPIILAGESQAPIGERTSQSGRRELAEWITSPDHPLTARVMVNRICQHVTGRGLVRTPDNFGRLGEPPTHPELLDHLTRRFIDSGWSVKQLVRTTVLSATFRQSSVVPPAVAAADPDNRLFGRMNRRRLTYEELRDTLHAVSGRLAPVAHDAQPRSDGDAELRTVYERIDRRETNVTAAIFDGPDAKAIVSVRPETTTAPQALYLMNNPLAADAAQNLATLVAGDPALATDDARLEKLWLTLFARLPATDELDEARSFMGRYSLGGLVHVLLAANEFVYVD
jgi:hypothetical protein